MKTYTECISIPTFEGRLEYLQTNSQVGIETFGFNRYLNQAFYKSEEWKETRNRVILRDGLFDLAFKERPLMKGIIIHHINSITETDIIERNPCLFDLNNLIVVDPETHNRIHYGSITTDIPPVVVERTPFDTCPWR